MRRLFILPFGFLLLATPSVAQSRWTLSTGAEWTRDGIPALRTWGARFRAEYDLTRPSSVFGLRLESGARWSPTQSSLYFDGNSYWAASEQKFDIVLGFNASISPIPKARVSPFASFGIFSRQEWTHGAKYLGPGPVRLDPNQTRTRGDIIGGLGLGLRARLSGHAFQLEYRRLYDQAGLTLGTRLPF